jgi:tripeptide aminopeptidase
MWYYLQKREHTKGFLMSDIQNKAIIDLFLELVAIDSPSGHEERVRIFILNYLEKKGVKSCVDARGNIVAYISEEYNERAILFASHIDTVPNAINVKPIVTDEHICTDETSALGADNKAAVASMLYAIDTLQEMKGEIDPVVYLFSVSEETGLDGVKELDTSLLPAIKEAYIPDAHSDIGKIIVHSPAKLDAKIVFHGRSSHAGFSPEEGISAISLAAKAIDQMKLLRINEHTTANVGFIQGGSVTNIVPASCTIKLEIRSNTEEKCYAHLAHLELCCIKAVGALQGSYELESDLRYPGYTVTKDIEPIVHLNKVFSKLNIESDLISSGGGSDTNILRGYGIDALTISSGYTNAHSEQERITTSSFSTITQIIIELAKKER